MNNIEAGKYYRQRDGRKAWVAGRTPSRDWIGLTDWNKNSSYATWRPNGRNVQLVQGLDLVSLWADEPERPEWGPTARPKPSSLVGFPYGWGAYETDQAWLAKWIAAGRPVTNKAALKYLILAGNYEQARRFARKRSLDPESWRYVHSIESIQGLVLRNVVIFHVGTWSNNPNSIMADAYLNNHTS